jgi:hypothetical protein
LVEDKATNTSFGRDLIGELPSLAIAKDSLMNMTDGLVSNGRMANESLIGMPVLYWDDPSAH